jgi:hypothetical protein
MMRFKFLFLAVALAAAIPACGGDDDETAGTTGGASGKGGSGGKGGSSNAGDNQGGETANAGTGSGTESVSKEISAADGGDVVLGGAALSIPGGSLAGDTTVTLETRAPGKDLPDAATVKGLLYDFGPDGTEFTKPAALTLPLVGTPGADEQAVIAWLDTSTNTWQDLATTVNDDGSVTAEIAHFTTFVVRFNGVVQSDCAFAACGGDVVGTWTVTGACASATTALSDMCPTALISLDITLSGSATFKADGTSTSDFTSKADISYTLDADCLSNITGGHPPSTCDDLSQPADDSGKATVCTGDPAVGCDCVQNGVEKTEAKTGTYVVDGSTMTTTDDADGSTGSLTFCVKGNDGRFQETSDDLAVFTWMATKQ